MSDNDMIQKGQDDLIRRGDAKQCCTDELRNTMQLLSNPPQSSAAWDARNAIDAIPAIPAVQPTVKPLVWFETADGGETCLTDERYSISYWEREKLFVDRYTTMRRHPTIEAAKAAAQADYEARILSALDMQPTVSPELLATTNDVAALVDVIRVQTGLIRGGCGGAQNRLNICCDRIDAALASVKGVM